MVVTERGVVGHPSEGDVTAGQLRVYLPSMAGKDCSNQRLYLFDGSSVTATRRRYIYNRNSIGNTRAGYREGTCSKPRVLPETQDMLPDPRGCISRGDVL